MSGFRRVMQYTMPAGSWRGAVGCEHERVRFGESAQPVTDKLFVAPASAGELGHRGARPLVRERRVDDTTQLVEIRGDAHGYLLFDSMASAASAWARRTGRGLRNIRSPTKLPQWHLSALRGCSKRPRV